MSKTPTRRSALPAEVPRHAFRLLAILLLVVPGVAHAQEDAPLRAEAAVESSRVYVGQAFLYQIQVSGSDSPERPDLSALRRDFSIEAAGGGANNSQQISIINGRLTRNVSEGYNFNFRLTPKRQGTLTIPAVDVVAGDRKTRTNSVVIEALPPTEIEDFKLRMRLSESQVYVGQPVVLTTTWYVGGNVNQFKMNMPVLEDPRFEVADPRVYIDPDHQDRYVDIPIGDRVVTAEKSRGKLDDYDYLTVAFEKVLAAREPGTIRLPASTISFRTLRRVRRGPRSVFDDFFGDSFFGSSRAYQTYTIPSNRPTLQVLPLPDQGRPADFSGLIGEFEFQAAATPTDVQVGDPITLKVTVSGPEYLEYVRLPNLAGQDELTADFKVPEEMSPGEIEGDGKVFTQTIRARHADVDAIPSLEWSYFDPGTGRYERARTEPIPVAVKGSRLVTAADAEGLGSSAVKQAEVESRQGGIAHNYDSPDALRPQRKGLAARLTSPGWAATLFGPPLIYLGLLGWSLVRRRAGGADSLRAREALRTLKDDLAALDDGSAFADGLLAAVRRYLGARLALPPGALTYGDVAPRLENAGVDEDALASLREIFDAGEAARYAGGAVEGDEVAWRDKARRTCESIDRGLG